MTFNQLSDKIFKNYQAGFVTDEQLVQLIELSVHHLNLKTLSNTAKFQNKSYNGIKNFQTCDIEIDGVKFYINNE